MGEPLTALAVPLAEKGVPQRTALAPRAVSDLWIRRRVGTIWFLLLFNVLGTLDVGASVLPIPSRFRQVMTAGALALALVLALSLNRRGGLRPNLVMGLSTGLLLVAVLGTVLESTSLGTVYRTFRFGEFTVVLWLLTPWWGRSDLLLARCHLRALGVICAAVVAGLVLSPSRAMGDGRLTGILWPIPPTQVGEYGAILAGLAIVLWLAGSMGGRRALLLAASGVGIVLLSHTRTALLGLAVGMIAAGVALFFARRRVRRVALLALVLGPLLLAVCAPILTTYLERGQTSADIADLSGRRTVWTELLDQRQSGAQRWIGQGITNKSFDGRAIDNDWLAVYQDEGLIGDALVGGVLVVLLVTPFFRPPSTARALAVFLAAYCAVVSYTEVGLGDATPYLLHVVVAASLLTPMGVRRTTAARHQAMGGHAQAPTGVAAESAVRMEPAVGGRR